MSPAVPLPVPEATVELLPPAERLEAAVEKATQHLVRKPDRWSSLEQRGRARRLLGHPGAVEDLVAAATRLDAIRRSSGGPREELRIANLLRLAGSPEATGWYRAAYDTDAASPTMDPQSGATVAFQLGLDAEAEARVGRLRGPSPVHLAIDAMARSRRTGGIGDLEAHREHLAGHAAEEEPWGSGSGYSVWDAIEDIDRTVAALSGAPPARPVA